MSEYQVGARVRHGVCGIDHILRRDSDDLTSPMGSNDQKNYPGTKCCDFRSYLVASCPREDLAILAGILRDNPRKRQPANPNAVDLLYQGYSGAALVAQTDNLDASRLQIVDGVKQRFPAVLAGVIVCNRQNGETGIPKGSCKFRQAPKLHGVDVFFVGANIREHAFAVAENNVALAQHVGHVL